MTLYDYLASLWRTVVPLIVGLAVVNLARLGIHIDSATVAGLLASAFSTVYYAVFRYAEQHLGKGWGWFLGLARPPKYTRLASLTPATAPPPGGTPRTPPADSTPGTPTSA